MPDLTVHEWLKWLSGLVGLLMYVPLVLDILRRGGRGHSFAMWALWALLDTTATVSLMLQQGNYLLTLGFSLGSILLSLLLLRYGQFKWGRLEWMVLLLVLLCLVVWAVAGLRGATIATTLAILFAGVPGLVELWRHPDPAAARVWAGFAVANLLALLGGESWSVAERFPPAAFTLQTLTMVLVGHRHHLKLSLVKTSEMGSRQP
jgi:hypothetical protein